MPGPVSLAKNTWLGNSRDPGEATTVSTPNGHSTKMLSKFVFLPID